MKIHQVTHLFYPDELAGASLYTDLAIYFRDHGHDVRVTTTFPYYPALRFRPEDQWVSSRYEVFEGIPIKRVGMILPKRHSGWRRLIPEVSYLAALTCYGRFADWTPDVVITACPMLSQVAWQRWAYPLKDIPSLVIVQDSMAHAATELGIIKAKGLGYALHQFERWSLKAPTKLSTISRDMQNRVNLITQATVDCSVIPNWIHESLAAHASKGLLLAESRETSRLFYSGNFGVKQGLPNFLETLKQVREGWTISLHGGGAEAETLAQNISGAGDWATVGGLLPESDYVRSLLRATACVVTQMPGVGANFLPSKLLPALATGTPVLAYCEADSPLGKEVKEGQFGAIITPNDTRQLAIVLRQWRDNLSILRRLSEAAIERAKLYSRDRSCGAYADILSELVSGRRQGL